MRLLVVLLLVFLAACSSVPVSEYVFRPATSLYEKSVVRRVLIDVAFDPADRDAIEGAVSAWNQTFAGAIVLETHEATFSIEEMLDPNAILVMKVDSSCTFIPSNGEGKVLAWANRVGGNRVWVIRDRFESHELQPIMLHELGHVFGADDRKGPGLMHDKMNLHDYRCIDKATAKEVATWQGLESLGYCE